ncbi:hypothetical protein QFZ67_000385 [Streptomyces sp. V1I1]|nr:hypothetical protein [Streptomyces sp. V1I1]
MSETTIEHESVDESAGGAMPSAASDEQLVAMLVDRARSEGLQLTGEGGLLQQLTKRVLESALEGAGSPTMSATRSTIRLGRTTATAATALVRRPC